MYTIYHDSSFFNITVVIVTMTITIVTLSLLSPSHNNYNNKKTFSIKMKEDVGTSKPKKHANKVGKLT